MSSGIAIVVGHSADAPGSVDALGMSEYDRWSPVAHVLSEALKASDRRARVFIRSSEIKGYIAKMRSLVAEVNIWDPAAVLSLHFNAGGGTRGVKALHYPGSLHGEYLAHTAATAARSVLGGSRPRVYAPRGRDGLPRSWQPTVHEDGTPWREGDRMDDLYPGGPPLYILSATEAPAAILEAYYGPSRVDTERCVALMPRLVESLADAIRAWGV